MGVNKNKMMILREQKIKLNVYFPPIFECSACPKTDDVIRE